MFRIRSLALGAALAGVGLAACGGDSTGSSSNDTMSAEEAGNVGGTLTSLINGAAFSISTFNVEDGNLTNPGLAPGVAQPRRNIALAALRVGARMNRNLGAVDIAPADGILENCAPTLDNTTDTDEDGILDDAIATYAAASCIYENIHGDTVTVAGTIRVQDQGELFGFKYTFNLHYDLSHGSHSGTVVLTGTYSADIGQALASAGQNLHVTATSSSGGNADLGEAWTLSFTPDGGVITGEDYTLPDGAFTIAGSSSATINGKRWSLTLVSTAPLVRSHTCLVSPVFASGTIEGQIVARRSHGFSVVFNGCGTDPTITALGTT